MLFCKHALPGSFPGLLVACPGNTALGLSSVPAVGRLAGPLPQAGECRRFQEGFSCASPGHVWTPGAEHVLSEPGGCGKPAVLQPAGLRAGLPLPVRVPGPHRPLCSRPWELHHGGPA